MSTDLPGVSGNAPGGNGSITSAFPPPGMPTVALEMARLCAEAYQTHTVEDRATQAAASVTLIQGQIGVKIVAAFKGSSTPQDFIQDAKFDLRMLGYSNAAHPVRVHAGFLEDISAIDTGVTQQVRGLMNRFPTAKLWITGHSLGGALALLYAVEAVRLGLPIAWVYTFGQPRVGDAAWAAMYGGFLGRKTVRVVDENDIIPRTPPWLMGYRHAGNLALIEPWNHLAWNPGLLRKLASDTTGLYEGVMQRQDVLIRNHFIEQYIARLRVLN
ncbi:MAG: lipase family protein [Patescibacteria group bacterium]|nr:lipase family protein [Patescibacteria group bacterium]